jgi:hypothetical protein
MKGTDLSIDGRINKWNRKKKRYEDVAWINPT